MAQQGGIAINYLLHISKWLEEKIYFFFIFEEYTLRGINGIGIDTVELIRGIYNWKDVNKQQHRNH